MVQVQTVQAGDSVPVCSTAACACTYLTMSQATVGDVEGSQPWAVQMEARAKWDAWNSVKGMSKEEAMSQYIAIVTKGDANWRVSCCSCCIIPPSILFVLRGLLRHYTGRRLLCATNASATALIFRLFCCCCLWQ